MNNESDKKATEILLMWENNLNLCFIELQVTKHFDTEVDWISIMKILMETIIKLTNTLRGRIVTQASPILCFYKINIVGSRFNTLESTKNLFLTPQ